MGVPKIYESEVNTMGKMIITSRVGNKVMVNYDDSRTHELSFRDEAEAEFFAKEIDATQTDFWTNGRDKATRKKSMFMDPAESSVSMNFNVDESSTKWPMKAHLSSGEDAKAFYSDVKSAIWGPMPG